MDALIHDDLVALEGHLEKDELLRQSEIFYQRYGFVAMSYVSFEWSAVVQSESAKANFFLSTTSPKWQARYSEKNYFFDDPVFKFALKSHSPFVWGTSFGTDGEITSTPAEVMLDARAHGYASGVTIPIHGPNNTQAMLTLFSSAELEETEMIFDREKYYFHLWGLSFNSHILKNHVKTVAAHFPELKPREKECITWLSQGKSDWEIGVILGLSERTVRFHLTNARKKLGVSSRAQLIAQYNSIRAIFDD